MRLSDEFEESIGVGSKRLRVRPRRRVRSTLIRVVPERQFSIRASRLGLVRARAKTQHAGMVRHARRPRGDFRVGASGCRRFGVDAIGAGPRVGGGGRSRRRQRHHRRQSFQIVDGGVPQTKFRVYLRAAAERFRVRRVERERAAAIRQRVHQSPFGVRRRRAVAQRRRRRRRRQRMRRRRRRRRRVRRGRLRVFSGFEQRVSLRATRRLVARERSQVFEAFEFASGFEFFASVPECSVPGPIPGPVLLGHRLLERAYGDATRRATHRAPRLGTVFVPLPSDSLAIRERDGVGEIAGEHRRARGRLRGGGAVRREIRHAPRARRDRKERRDRSVGVRSVRRLGGDGPRLGPPRAFCEERGATFGDDGAARRARHRRGAESIQRASPELLYRRSRARRVLR